jgi:tRNA-splicing ligase RtcB
MKSSWNDKLKLQRLNDHSWRIPREGPMKTDGIVYADDRMMESIAGDMCLQQVANVACLPGIVGPSIGMPDIHWGYGFPIGGVAAFDLEQGVISPGGVGYDINCGVRLLSTNLDHEDVKDRVRDFVVRLFANVPSGVGQGRKDLKLTEDEARQMTSKGARWAVEHGFGTASDLDFIEEGGVIPGADFDEVSARAFQRGRSQLGTIGSGNHFVELGVVDELYEPATADRIGLRLGGITVIIHTGSRGFGHQICEDHLRLMQKAAETYKIYLPDRQLCCAPISSPEGKRYMAAMACGANFAFANRQIITHWVRETFEEAWGMTPREHGVRVVYDVCHNIAKVETHPIGGQPRRVCVHRKGATRAFPPGHPDVPEVYREVGQPVLVPGDMGRYSYVLIGHAESPELAFASSCHGAGRLLSRKKALEATRDRHVVKELEAQGIHVMADDRRTIDEEFPGAYKDVAEVVDVVHQAKLARKVARLRPIGVIKG